MQKILDKLNNLTFWKICLILVFVFGLSLIPRISNIGRPLSLHHEWLTATSVRTIQLWYENGASNYHFNQIMTFNNEADKNIREYAGYISNKKGDFYYVSYPPFGMILPFTFFKILNIYPSVSALQIFNTFLHFISGFFIFLILRKLTDKNNLASLIGFTIYLFSPATMWFQSNVYMSDTAVQPLFIIGLYLFLQIIKSEKLKPKYLYLLGILNFLMIYTEWIGVFFAFTIAIYCLFNLKKKDTRLILFTITISGLAAVALTIFQYSKINDLTEIFNYLSSRYSFRSGVIGYGSNSIHNSWDPNIFALDFWLKLKKYYINGLLSLIFFCLILFLWAIKDKQLKIKNNKNFLFWSLCLFPVILHHLAFFNWSVVHDLSVLKSTPFFALAGAYLFSKIKLDQKNIYFFILLFVFTIYSSLVIYNTTNYRFESHYKESGEIINTTAKNDEVVFMMAKNIVEPHYMVYARRNIALYKSKEEALELIHKNKAKRGIVFVFSYKDKKITDIYYLE